MEENEEPKVEDVGEDEDADKDKDKKKKKKIKVIIIKRSIDLKKKSLKVCKHFSLDLRVDPYLNQQPLCALAELLFQLN
jgi:hypothetical protein